MFSFLCNANHLKESSLFYTFFNQIFKRKSLSLGLLDQAIVSGSNFLSTIILLKILGIEEFGVFSSLWLISLLINSLHAALIVFPMMTLIPHQVDKKRYFDSLISMQYLFVLIGSLVSFISAICYFIFLQGDISFYLISAFVLTVFSYHMQDFYRRYFFANKEQLEVIKMDILSYGFRVGILCVLIFVDDVSILEIFFCYSLCFLAGCFVGVRKYRGLLNLPLKVDIIQHWKISKWLLPSGIMQWTSVNLFILMSSFLIGPVAVGAIKIGQNVVFAFNVVLQSIENFIPINAGNIHISSGYNSMYKYYEKILKIGIILVLVYSSLICVFSEEIIMYVYGTEYSEFNYVIYWFSIILIFMFLLSIFRMFLRSINETRIWFRAYLNSSIISIFLVYPLEKFLGLNGALFGILIAHIILILSAALMIIPQHSKRKYSEIY